MKLDSYYPTATEMEKKMKEALPKAVICQTGKRSFKLEDGKSVRMKDLVSHAENLCKSRSVTPEEAYKLSSLLVLTDMAGERELRNGTRLQKIGNLIRRFFTPSHFIRLEKMVLSKLPAVHMTYSIYADNLALLSSGLLKAFRDGNGVAFTSWKEKMDAAIAKPTNFAGTECLRTLSTLCEIESKAQAQLKKHLEEAVQKKSFPIDPKSLDGYQEVEQAGKEFLKALQKLYAVDQWRAIHATRDFTRFFPELSFCLHHFSDKSSIDPKIVELLQVSQAYNTVSSRIYFACGQ